MTLDELIEEDGGMMLPEWDRRRSFLFHLYNGGEGPDASGEPGRHYYYAIEDLNKEGRWDPERVRSLLIAWAKEIEAEAQWLRRYCEVIPE